MTYVTDGDPVKASMMNALTIGVAVPTGAPDGALFIDTSVAGLPMTLNRVEQPGDVQNLVRRTSFQRLYIDETWDTYAGTTDNVAIKTISGISISTGFIIVRFGWSVDTDANARYGLKINGTIVDSTAAGATTILEAGTHGVTELFIPTSGSSKGWARSVNEYFSAVYLSMIRLIGETADRPAVPITSIEVTARLASSGANKEVSVGNIELLHRVF